MRLRNIIVPIDFSDHSLHALRIASNMASEAGAALHLVHIWQPMAAFNALSPPAVILAAREEAARRQIEALQPAPQSVRVHRYLGTGSPADEIIRIAEALAADLVVLGTYGRSGSAPSAIGSVAEAVVRRASCPVLSCKLPTELDLRRGGRTWDIMPLPAGPSRTPSLDEQ